MLDGSRLSSFRVVSACILSDVPNPSELREIRSVSGAERASSSAPVHTSIAEAVHGAALASGVELALAYAAASHTDAAESEGRSLPFMARAAACLPGLYLDAHVVHGYDDGSCTRIPRVVAQALTPGRQTAWASPTGR